MSTLKDLFLMIQSIVTHGTRLDTKLAYRLEGDSSGKASSEPQVKSVVHGFAHRLIAILFER